MDVNEIKERILAIEGIEFIRLENWFFKFGCNRINRNAKSSKVRQAILNLSDKDFDFFWQWYDDLCHERYMEEVENDPIAQKYLEIGYMIMSKPDPGQFLVDLFSGKNRDKEKK